jgi:hypothetical protein
VLPRCTVLVVQEHLFQRQPVPVVHLDRQQ